MLPEDVKINNSCKVFTRYKFRITPVTRQNPLAWWDNIAEIYVREPHVDDDKENQKYFGAWVRLK